MLLLNILIITMIISIKLIVAAGLIMFDDFDRSVLSVDLSQRPDDIFAVIRISHIQSHHHFSSTEGNHDRSLVVDIDPIFQL
jgi:hypothetical protein